MTELPKPAVFAVRRWSVRLAIVAAVCNVFAPAGRAAESTPPNIAELVQRIVARDEENRARRRAYEFDLEIKTERLDAAGNVIKAKTTRAQSQAGGKIRFSTDLSPDANTSAEEQARAAREVKSGQRMQAVMELKNLAPHYNYALEGSAVINGRDCWILRFRPKPGAPAGNKEERVVQALQGRFWIDKATDSVVQSEGSLTAPVTMAVVAAVNQLDFQYGSQTLPNGDIGPLSFRLFIAVKAPFYDFRQRQVSLKTNYRIAQGAAQK